MGKVLRGLLGATLASAILGLSLIATSQLLAPQAVSFEARATYRADDPERKIDFYLFASTVTPWRGEGFHELGALLITDPGPGVKDLKLGTLAVYLHRAEDPLRAAGADIVSLVKSAPSAWTATPAPKFLAPLSMTRLQFSFEWTFWIEFPDGGTLSDAIDPGARFGSVAVEFDLVLTGEVLLYAGTTVLATTAFAAWLVGRESRPSRKLGV